MNDKNFIKELSEARESMQRFATKLTSNHDDALDLLQETMLRAYSKRFCFIEGTNFTFWILTVMRNVHFNRIAHEKRCPLSVISDYQNYNYSDIFDESGIINVNDIIQAIEELPSNFAIPFKMFLAGYHYDEIAEELNLPVGTVKNRIHAARLRLRIVLSEFIEKDIRDSLYINSKF